MDASHNIRLAEAYSEVVALFGAEHAKALNKFTAIAVEAGHDRLVTDSMLIASEQRTAQTLKDAEMRIEDKVESLRRDLVSIERRVEDKIDSKVDSLRRDIDTKLWAVIAMLIANLGGVLFAILGK